MDDADPFLLPRFTWVRRGVLAAMARPGRESWPALHRLGIRAVLSLTEIRPAGDPEAHGLSSRHEPIVDFSAPTMEQLERCVTWIESRLSAAEPVVVHCTAGIGRTGTVVSAWLVATGMEAGAAIDLVRRLRPGSVETEEQEEAVRRYAERRGRRGGRE